MFWRSRFIRFLSLHDVSGAATFSFQIHKWKKRKSKQILIRTNVQAAVSEWAEQLGGSTFLRSHYLKCIYIYI